MTIEQTRQLAIEFERRVQTMIPEKEFADKLDSETIFSFLNQYQDKYINDIYRSLDSVPSGTTIQAHLENILQSLLIEKSLTTPVENSTIDIPAGDVIVSTGRSQKYTLPEDFRMYVRSVSKVSETFAFKSMESAQQQSIRILPNKLVSQTDIWKLLETPHNTLRILRYPAAVLTPNKTITVVYDQYTKPAGIKLTYYKQPQHFDIMTSTCCELPMDAFNDLVTGAVDLYVDYVAGAESRKNKMREQAQKRAREDQRDARRSGGNQDEQQ